MKKLHLTAGLLLLCVLLLLGAGTIDLDKLFASHNGKPLPELKAKGDSLIGSGQADSAVALYAMVANSYSKSLPEGDRLVCAKALNNIGYVNFYYYNNYSQAYDYYLRCLDVLETLPKPNIESTVYLNIANIYVDYTDYKASTGLYREAFRAAIAEKSWSTVLIAYAHLLSNGIADSSDLRSVRREFSSLRPPKMPLLTYVRLLDKGYASYQEKNYNQALRLFRQAAGHADSPDTPERYKAEALMMGLKVLEETRRYDAAIDLCHELIATLRGKHADDLLSAVYANLYYFHTKKGDKPSARESLFAYYAINDTLFNARRSESLHSMRSVHKLKIKEEELREARVRHKIQMTVFLVSFTAAAVIIALLLVLYRKSRRQGEMLSKLYHQALEQARAPKTYKRGTMDDNTMREILDKVYAALAESTDIYQQDFSSEQFSEMIGVRNRDMTQAIRELTGKNFNTLLGEQRVKEACRQLLDKEHNGHLTMEAISAQLGFKSRTNFISVFKKFTGLTPSEFIKMSAKEQESKD